MAYLEDVRELGKAYLLHTRDAVEQLPRKDTRDILNKELDAIESMMYKAHVLGDGEMLDNIQRKMLNLSKYLAAIESSKHMKESRRQK